MKKLLACLLTILLALCLAFTGCADAGTTDDLRENEANERAVDTMNDRTDAGDTDQAQ